MTEWIFAHPFYDLLIVIIVVLVMLVVFNEGHE